MNDSSTAPMPTAAAAHQRHGPFHVRRGSMDRVLRVMASEARPQYAGSSCRRWNGLTVVQWAWHRLTAGLPACAACACQSCPAACSTRPCLPGPNPAAGTSPATHLRAELLNEPEKIVHGAVFQRSRKHLLACGQQPGVHAGRTKSHSARRRPARHMPRLSRLCPAGAPLSDANSMAGGEGSWRL